MKSAAKFLGMVVILNVIRYIVGGPLEFPVTSRLFCVMETYPGVFNNQFTPTDWATSFFYNFMMWLTATWVFVLTAPGLRGERSGAEPEGLRANADVFRERQRHLHEPLCPFEMVLYLEFA